MRRPGWPRGMVGAGLSQDNMVEVHMLFREEKTVRLSHSILLADPEEILPITETGTFPEQVLRRCIQTGEMQALAERRTCSLEFTNDGDGGIVESTVLRRGSNEGRRVMDGGWKIFLCSFGDRVAFSCNSSLHGVFFECTRIQKKFLL